ncbi:MAG: protein kinase [Planctomycetaceae bacterium]|nr:protein kinase [Planctomycetaceae bacterium]
MSITISQFLQRLETSGILSESDLASVHAIAAEQDAAGEAEPLVKRLHKEGRLTGYQVQILWKGKGQQLALGNYVIEDELGRGGMGVVLKARHKRMQRCVAIKVLPTAMVKDAAAIARFQREVVAAAKLNHTNIVGAFDADEINGQHILVMEFVDGRDLSSIVKKQGRLPIKQAVDCVLQAARGLEFAHKQGVVHRDIKPANLLLDASGVVKILDMGLARLSGTADVGEQAELTGTGVVMGTVDYMSPEQALSTKSADHRADIYSLGITLYYLLTAEPAYAGDSLMARLMAHANSPIPALSAARPDVSPLLQQVFERMVAKKVEDRYQSMSDVIADLEASQDDSPGSAVILRSRREDESSGQLANFLRQLEGGGGSQPSQIKTAKSERLVKPVMEAQTLVSGADIGTSRSLPRRKRSHAAKSAKPHGRTLWTDWRVLAGTGGGAVVVLMLAVAIFSRRPALPSQVTQSALPVETAAEAALAPIQVVTTSVPSPSPETLIAVVPPQPPAGTRSEVIQRLTSPDYEWTAPENLGPGINSSSPETLAGLSDDELTIYLQRGYNGQLLKSERTRADIPFPTARVIVNDKAWNDQFNVSGNGLSLIGLSQSSQRKRQVAAATRQDLQKPFSAPALLPSPVNENSAMHPVQSSDGLTLLVTSTRPGSRNGDIWMFTRPALDRPFETVENLPFPANTPDWDMPAYISNDRLVLLTMSQGKDFRRIFLVTRVSVGAPFGPAVPLDMPLGPATDSTGNGAFTLSGDGKSVYFYSRSMPGGHGAMDIWVSRRVRKTSGA